MAALMVFSRLDAPLNNALYMYSSCTFAGAVVMVTLVYRGCRAFDARG
jgi:hypothetical protein